MATVIADDLEICTDCALLVANGEGTGEHAARMLRVWGENLLGLVLAGGDDEPCFGTRPCDGCSSQLAGDRHPAAVLA